MSSQNGLIGASALKTGGPTPTPPPAPPVQPDLPAHRLKRVEAAAADYQILMQERDDLDLRLHQAQKKITELQVQVDALQKMIDMVEGTARGVEERAQERINRTTDRCDEYAERALTLEASLANVYRILHDVVAGKTYPGMNAMQVSDDPPAA